MIKNSVKVFMEVCRSGSFTKAAAKLYVTPSAVMQQIDALEKEYGAKLFTRSHKGVQLTSAGEYLLEKAMDLMRQDDDIRSHISAIAKGNSTICVGTSIKEKCRLLYDLWTLYSQINPDSKIEMVNINTDIDVPCSVDLIESINSGLAWMRGWDFLEICRVPIGIAMEKTDPLARKKIISISDLAGREVVAFKNAEFEGKAPALRILRDVGAVLGWMEAPSPSAFWECVFQHRLLLVAMCWSDILAGPTLRPIQWDIAFPYGIFSRPDARSQVTDFLTFIRTTYAGTNPNDIVPVLDY